jgi:DNA-binding MarR family transcriptional regulator
MIKLNMLNKVLKDNIDQTHSMNTYEFYKVLIYLINMRLPNKLTSKEIEVIAAILYLCPKMNPFKQMGAKKVRDFLKIKSPNYLKMKRDLTSKGYVINEDIIFKGFTSLKNVSDIELVYKIKVTND